MAGQNPWRIERGQATAQDRTRDLVNRQRKTVMAGFDPAIHGRGEAEMAAGEVAMMKSFVPTSWSVSAVFRAFGAWMAGSSPAMTTGRRSRKAD
jgi:hypothetical protein